MEQNLAMLKIDLGITTTAYDARLTSLLEAAVGRIAEEGITLDASRADDNALLVMYAGWLWRKRDSMEGMPRMLRYALNNRLFAEKMAMKDDVITLYKGVRTQDEYGRWIEGEPERREVYARVLSISRREFFEAGRNGLNPEFRFDVFQGDYQGETVVEYHGATYSVYRTYESGDYMELYAERKGGTDGKRNST